LEKGVAYDPANAFAAYELQVGLVSGQETLNNQPTRISAQTDDGAGNITFRIFPSPDIVYNVAVIYQQAAPQFTLTTQTWAPVPDFMSYLYDSGFIARGFQYFADPRYEVEMQMFLSNLVANSEGLSESQKNLWISDRLNSLRQSAAVQSGKR